MFLNGLRMATYWLKDIAAYLNNIIKLVVWIVLGNYFVKKKKCLISRTL
jgi:hypothetical protein